MSKLKPNQFYILDWKLITERGILFQPKMVKANLKDRKTNTRRTNGLDQINENPDDWSLCWVGNTVINNKHPKVFGVMFQNKTSLDQVYFSKSLYGKPGNLLYVRENWARIEARIYFQADGSEDELIEEYSLDKISWKPSIHLPKYASRIWAMVEDIRVERLKDINEDDAKTEGIREGYSFGEYYYWDAIGYATLPTAKEAFKTLWCFVNGKGAYDETPWNSNPWVWVIKYRILSKTGRPSMDVIEQAYCEIFNLKSESHHV